MHLLFSQHMTVLQKSARFHILCVCQEDTKLFAQQSYRLFVRVADAHLFVVTFLSFCLSVCLSVESISHEQSKWIEAIDSSFESPSTLVDTSR